MSTAGVISGDHTFNPKLDYNHADDKEYKRLRDLAHQEWKKRSALADKSKAAYQRGDGGEAKELSNQAKKHADKMDEYNNQAADFVFRANNADSEPDEIDLHGLYVKEAEERLAQRIQACLQRKDTHLDVIVGKGIHSENHVQKLKPAVEDLCKEHNFKYAMDEDNAGVLIIDFTQGGGHVNLSDIAKRNKKQQRPHPQHGQYPGGQNQNKYHKQQGQHGGQGQDVGGLLFKIFCGIVKACMNNK